jgi:hypothetical protein
MATGLELYEALKPTVGEEAAKMIAEAMPMGDQVATKTDFAALRSDFALLRADLHSEVERLTLYIDGRISASEARMFRWILGFFATLWVSNVGIIVTLLLKG